MVIEAVFFYLFLSILVMLTIYLFLKVLTELDVWVMNRHYDTIIRSYSEKLQMLKDLNLEITKEKETFEKNKKARR